MTSTYQVKETIDKKPSNCQRCLLLIDSKRKSAYICTAKYVHDCKIYGRESNIELLHCCCIRKADVALNTNHDLYCKLCTLEQTSVYNSTTSRTSGTANITEIRFIKEREHKMITRLLVHVDECLMCDEHSPLLIVLTELAFKKPMTDLPTDAVKVISCLTDHNQSVNGPQNKRNIYLVNVTLIDKSQREKHNLTYESHLCKMADSKVKLSKVRNAVTDKPYLPDNVYTDHRNFCYQNNLPVKHMTKLALSSLKLKTQIKRQSIFCSDAVLDSMFKNVIKTTVSDNIKHATINRTKNTRMYGYCDRNKEKRQLHSCLKRIKNCVQKFHVALPFLFWTHVLFMLSLLTAISCQDITVTWNMKSNMTIFGKTAELECAISDYTNSCNGNIRQWYGGKPYDFLCRNGDCRNNAKYFERTEGMCKYTLTIYNFSENDVNCEYTCSYGVHRSRKMLKLDGQHFTYVPSMNEVNYTVKVQDTVNATVFIPKVYPSPLCQAFFADKKITTITNISSVGYLYETEIQIVYTPPVDNCKGVLNINCTIGSTYFTPVYQNVTVCPGVTDINRHSEVSAVIGIVIVILIILVATVMAFLHCTKFGKRIKEKCNTSNLAYKTTYSSDPAWTDNSSDRLPNT